jgi:hypothetical protein
MIRGDETSGASPEGLREGFAGKGPKVIRRECDSSPLPDITSRRRVETDPAASECQGRHGR